MLNRPHFGFPTELVLLALTVFSSWAYIAAKVFFPG
jgi:hypothetical protein